MFFTILWLYFDFLEFPSVNQNRLKFSQHIASSGIRILSMKRVGFVKGVFFDFFNFFSIFFSAAKKLIL